jgi:CheY-like chemotaxis protein
MKVEPVELLLVEDNIHDEILTKKALEKHNLTNSMYVAKDGVEALDFLFGRGKFEHRQKLNNPKLVLLDLKLPKIDGLEVLKIIKEDKRTKNIPVVVLTSSAEETDIVQTYRLGANSYIVKPVDFDKFMYSVSELGLYWLLLNEPPIESKL